MQIIYLPDGKTRKISDNKLRCRTYPEYFEFKKNVLARDKYKCICCGKDYELKIHHLDGYDKFPKKRLLESNAVTLCKNCHKNFHLRYGRGNNTREQFEEWFRSVKDIVSMDIPNLNETRPIYCYETDKYYKGCMDLIFSLNLTLTSKKAIINTCHRKGNVFSVNGYHLMWGDIAEDMSEQEKMDYVLHNLDNYRRPFVLDLRTGYVFSNGHIIAEHYGLEQKSVNYYTRKYKTVESITKYKSPWILYKDFESLSEAEQRILLKDKQIRFYKEERYVG